MYILCQMLCFGVDFNMTHDGALSSALLLPISDIVCAQGKVHCFKAGISCCFCTLSPSSSALGESKAPTGAAQLTPECSAAKQRECPNLTCSKVNRGQWSDLVQMKWE